MKKLIRNLPLVLTVIVIGALLAYGFRPVPVEVDVVTVEEGSFDISVDDDGITRIREKYVVSAPVAGKLHRIDLDPGDEVEQDLTVLAQMDPTDPTLLDKRAEAQAEARLRGAKAAVKLSHARSARVAEALKMAATEFKRAQALRKKKAMAASDFDRKQHEFEMAQADSRSAEFAVKVAEFEAQLAEAALIRTRGVEEEKTLGPGESYGDIMAAFSITAPVSGRVLRVFTEDAGVVNRGTRLLELGDPRDLEMQIDVLSSEAVRIVPGAKVFVDYWGGEEPLEGVVRVVEPSAFVKVSALGVEEHRVNVIADFRGLLDCCHNLGDGFRIEARIVIDSVQNAIVVPAGVLFRTDDKWATFKVVDGQAKLQHVSIGRSNGAVTEVLEGLSVGDQLVLHPTDAVDDSVPVQTTVQ
ncbi:MAG: efflux RND transporter periplasmic adaptor subunit [Planctomycetaceae bacterium]